MTKQFFVRGFLFLVTLAIGAGLFVWLLIREGVAGILESLSSFGILAFLGFVAISIFNFVLYSLRWKIILDAHLPKNKRLSLYQMFMNRMSGYSVSYLTPAAQVGGEPVRIAMLNTDGVPLKQSTSSVLLDITFELTAYIGFILAGVILAFAEGLTGGNSLLIIFVGIVVALLVLVAFIAALASGKGVFHGLFHLLRLNRIAVLSKFDNGIKETEQMMTKFLHGKTSLLLAVSFLTFFVVSFRVIETFYIAYFFGVDMNFAQAFLISTLPGVALLLPIPAGIGVFEGSFAALFGILAVPLNAVGFALIIRMRDIIFIAVGALHILGRGRSFIERKIFKGM